MYAKDNEWFMQRCLKLAQQGRNYVAPNPMVGCVIVNNGRIIGEGYHAKYGEEHAEVKAIQSVRNKELLKKSTLYVNLEPCCHYGKTPPCVELIIQHQIPKVIIGSTDVNPKVSGKGISCLKEKGIKVQVGILEEACKNINIRFFTFHQEKRPYIILKWAETLDGFMDINRNLKEKNKSYWITNEALKLKVHQWRAQESAIFTGANTIINDNPQLNIRYCAGNNPIRITFLKSPIETTSFSFFDNSQKTIVFNSFKEEIKDKTEYILIKNDNNIEKEILEKLYKRNCQSIIIEGGKKTLERFIQAKLWDEARILVGNKFFVSGLKAPILSIMPYKIEQINEDKVVYIKNTLV
ncbi:MAG: bifunctional diaminohydroxyphosphoribosylaminopyrimidine deaminase/5-amino-6-(5-phosphoribosylamino)uracil reductase RibD [Bacteroidales bacterium]|nr:bifunctional diaminohydroxyphosphoribosylaminopyrimidine deaminase/5-amino-6-(5-phosphoribosylamino)uracil reductase RibD [Bacteroidales bacterium]